MNHDLIGLKSRKSNYKPNPPIRFSWTTYAIAVFVFIANKAIQSILGFTPDTNNIIDIFAVIGIVTVLAIHTYTIGGKNNG